METLLTLIRELNLLLGGTETGTAPLLVAGGIVFATGMFVTFCVMALKPLRPLFTRAGQEPSAHAMKGIREAALREGVVGSSRDEPSRLRRPSGRARVIAVRRPAQPLKKN